MPEWNQTSSKAAGYHADGYRYLDASPPDYVNAERSFRQALDIFPDFGESLHALGFTLEQQNKLDEAAETLRKAILLLPSDPRPLIRLGAVLGKLKRYDEAITFFEEGIRLKPAYAEADAKLMLAEVYEELHQLDKAADLWRQVAVMDAFYPSYDLPMLEAKDKLAEYGIVE